MPSDILKDTPFHDFLIPGVILFLINGVGQLATGILSLRKHPFAGYAGAVFGMVLMIWIFMQVNMIGGNHILQCSYFMLGVLETTLAFLTHNFLLITREHRSIGENVQA
jgi:membrane associated rhomboid family serine protease